MKIKKKIKKKPKKVKNEKTAKMQLRFLKNVLAAQSIFYLKKFWKYFFVWGDGVCKRVSGTPDRYIRLVLQIVSFEDKWIGEAEKASCH